MPFQYSPYRSPFAQSIADSIARSNDAYAQAALRAGDAQARATEIGGQAWSRAIEQTGQIPAQMEARQDVKQTRELRRQEIEARTEGRKLEKQQRFATLVGSLAGGASSPEDFSSRVDDLIAIGGIEKALGDHMKQQIASAGPDGWAALKQQYVDLGASFAKPVTVAEGAKVINPASGKVLANNPKVQRPVPVGPGGLADPATGKIIVQGREPQATPASLAKEAAGGDAVYALQLLHPDKPDTAAQDDQKYESLVQKNILKQTLTPEESAFVKAYEQRKTVGVEASAAAAANRQAKAIDAQAAQQKRAQDFQEAQAGRKELSDKVELPYAQAQEKAEVLKDVVRAAQAGNMSAAAVQKLMGVLGVVTIEGVQRINTTELTEFGAQGDLLTRIKGRIGSLVAGQPLAPAIQKDIIELADVLEKGSRRKYEDRFREITKRYGLKDEQMKPPAGAPAPGTERTVNGVTRVWGYYDGQWGWKQK